MISLSSEKRIIMSMDTFLLLKFVVWGYFCYWYPPGSLAVRPVYAKKNEKVFYFSPLFPTIKSSFLEI